MMGYKWKPLKPVTTWREIRPELVAAWMKEFGLEEAEARKRIKAERDGQECFANDIYQVEVRRPTPGLVWLCIRRRDGYVGRDWQHFQQIKNELVGEECEGVELYPAESRRVDTSNKYHLFCFSDPEVRVPFGYVKRDVRYGDDETPGLRQSAPLQFARRSNDA